VTLRSNPSRDLPACPTPPVRTPGKGARQAPQPQECGGGVRWEIVRRGLRAEAATARLD